MTGGHYHETLISSYVRISLYTLCFFVSVLFVVVVVVFGLWRGITR